MEPSDKPPPVLATVFDWRIVSALMARYGLTEVEFTKEELAAAKQVVRVGERGVRKI